MWEYNYTDNLLHSGVKGMEWGRRLYQNKDGSLTALGKQRYGTKGNYEKVQAAKRAASPEKLKAAKARAKAQARTEAEIEKYKKKKEEAVNGKTTDEKAPKEKKTIMSVSKEKQNTSNVIRDKRAVKKMSDAELDAALSRLQKEQKYKDMIDGENIKKGKEALSDALRNSGKQAITTVATAGFTYAGKQALKKLMGPEYEDAWNEMFGVKKSKSTSSLIDDLRNGRTRLENLNDDELGDIARRTASESTIRDRLGLNRTNNATTNNSTNNVSNETTSTPLSTPLSTQSRTNGRRTSRAVHQTDTQLRHLNQPVLDVLHEDLALTVLHSVVHQTDTLPQPLIYQLTQFYGVLLNLVVGDVLQEGLEQTESDQLARQVPS